MPMQRPHDNSRLQLLTNLLRTLALIFFVSACEAQVASPWEWPNTDFTITSIDLNEVMSGGPPKDGIPAIDEPKFVDNTAAESWLHDQEPVITVVVDGFARAYPVQILMYHEIVNDELNGLALSVTFCPLCNASIVFERELDGRILDFGTTGRLRKSDLVMYDRQTESWWQQFTGTGIVGSLTASKLRRYPAYITSFADFKRAFPHGEVLSRETGFSRPYGNNPYRGYDSITDQPFLFRDPVDPRLPPMEYVLNVSVDNQHKLYPFSRLENEVVVNDIVFGVPVVVLTRHGTFSALDQSQISASRQIPSATAFSRRLNGQDLEFTLRDGRVIDEQTGSTWNIFGRATGGPLQGRQLAPVDSGVHFAFAWLAFNPDSEIY